MSTIGRKRTFEVTGFYDYFRCKAAIQQPTNKKIVLSLFTWEPSSPLNSQPLVTK